MSEPRVTVGIATYNGVKHLPQQLDTILAQTHRNLDVIAVDDNSTDGTVELLQKYARSYPVRVVCNPTNVGFVKNFERVLKECYSDGAPLVALADQDDIWHPSKIAQLVRYIGDFALIYNPAEWIQYPDGTLDRPSHYQAYMAYCRRRGTGRRVSELLANNFVISHQIMLRRDIIPTVVPFPAGLLFHDHWIALNAALRGGIKFHQADLMIYRQHSASATYSGLIARKPWRKRLTTWFTRHVNFLTTIRAQDELLARWEKLPEFSSADFAMIAQIRSLYTAMLRPGPNMLAVLEAARLEKYFYFPVSATRVRFYLSALLGSRLSSLSNTPSCL